MRQLAYSVISFMGLNKKRRRILNRGVKFRQSQNVHRIILVFYKNMLKNTSAISQLHV